MPTISALFESGYRDEPLPPVIAHVTSAPLAVIIARLPVSRPGRYRRRTARPAHGPFPSAGRLVCCTGLRKTTSLAVCPSPLRCPVDQLGTARGDLAPYQSHCGRAARDQLGD